MRAELWGCPSPATRRPQKYCSGTLRRMGTMINARGQRDPGCQSQHPCCSSQVRRPPAWSLRSEEEGSKHSHTAPSVHCPHFTASRLTSEQTRGTEAGQVAPGAPPELLPKERTHRTWSSAHNPHLICDIPDSWLLWAGHSLGAPSQQPQCIWPEAQDPECLTHLCTSCTS